MTESNSIAPDDRKLARQMQSSNKTATKSSQQVTSKDDHITESLNSHRDEIKRESEDENLSGDSNNNDTYETDTCCSEAVPNLDDVECDDGRSLCGDGQPSGDETTTAGDEQKEHGIQQAGGGAHQHSRGNHLQPRMPYTSAAYYLNRFHSPIDYYARPPPPLATTYYNQAPQNQTHAFYGPVCLDQSGAPVLPIHSVISNNQVPFAANDWLYAQCNPMGQFANPYHYGQLPPAQVYCSNNAQSDIVAALYTAPWVPPAFHQPVPQPVVLPTPPLAAQVSTASQAQIKSRKYHADVQSDFPNQSADRSSSIESQDPDTGVNSLDTEDVGSARVEIEEEVCQDEECTECGLNTSNDATEAVDVDRSDPEQVDDNVKTHASYINASNVNKTANRHLSTSDDDLIDRDDKEDQVEAVDKNQQRQDVKQRTASMECCDIIDGVENTRLATISDDGRPTSESDEHKEQEAEAEPSVEYTDSAVDKERELQEELSAELTVSPERLGQHQQQQQQHNQPEPTVIIDEHTQPNSYQHPPLPGANGHQESSMTSKSNISPTNDLSETTPKQQQQQQQQDSRLFAAALAASDDISHDPNVTKDNPSISVRQTNYQAPLTSACPTEPLQPAAHSYQYCTQYVALNNSHVTSDLETNKSSTELNSLVDTCQLSGVTQILPGQPQGNIRPQQVLYGHQQLSHYNQHLNQPPLVYQPPNSSPYLGLIPVISSKQPLIYAYQYGPYYGPIQQQCRPTTNHFQYHQQSIQYYPTHIPRSHVSNGANIQPVPVDPATLFSYNQPLFWQSHPAMPVPINEQGDYLRQFQQPITGTRLSANLVSLLPILAEPARIRQAYGMDKVWLDEFETLFAQFMSSNMLWTLIEVETNPSIRRDADIIGYKGRYIVRVNPGLDRFRQQTDHRRTSDHQLSDSNLDSKSTGNTVSDDLSDEEDSHVDEGRAQRADLQTPTTDNQSDRETGDKDEGCSIDETRLSTEASARGVSLKKESFGEGPEEKQKIVLGIDEIYDKSNRIGNYDNDSSRQSESDCDSGAVMANSATTATSGGEESVSEESQRKLPADRDAPVREHGCLSNATDRKHARRFRMFIDSAKVRFCCDICGHGWTSMKGRVVFWYELFELVHDDKTPGNLIGYCAYKLFGQQCDVCQVEGRFERPMWYPEEVTKALNNLCNKIGQVYFGFKMPAIDKQRRAGKPKTSHNSTLCQACHDGVCTDRK